MAAKKAKKTAAKKPVKKTAAKKAVPAIVFPPRVDGQPRYWLVKTEPVVSPARSQPELFGYLKHPAPHVLARRGQWTSTDGRIRWELRQGDFLETLSDAEAPDLILFDPFSTKVDAPLWSVETFERLRGHAGSKSATLVTYSNSTVVRARLLSAGWFVAPGVSTGPRTETTMASTTWHEGWPYLDDAFLDRWRRSHLRDPALDGRVSSHHQFQLAREMTSRQRAS